MLASREMKVDGAAPDQIISLMEVGDIVMQGLVSWGSNYTFLVQVCHDGQSLDAVYKPSKGERPLWDFTSGSLCVRERLAYLVSEVIGWHLVPPTILRDGPHGWGSLQLFIEHNPRQHYLTIQGSHDDEIKRIVLFDFLINNADRKSGHVLLAETGRLWAIDHGVAFHEEYKLRSVIWEFAGHTISEVLLKDLRVFEGWLKQGRGDEREELEQRLSSREIKALRTRTARLIESRQFPHPGPGRHYPWPLI